MLGIAVRGVGYTEMLEKPLTARLALYRSNAKILPCHLGKELQQTQA